VTAAALLLHCAETPVGVSFPTGFSFLSFFFLLPNCISRFPCRYPRFFGFSVSVVPLSLSLSRSVSLSFGFSPRLLLFSLSSSSFRVTIYRGRGSGVDLAPSHHRPCMVRTSPPLQWRRPWWPMEALLMEHGCSGISS